ncbi:hypothetical protein [Tabrizicola sp.]|uniref:hypothetical protein n=1 Tax=Tabrizicola sp. TaxID=2005166 RepID=UPI0025D959F9|nr:hypothetical protein [Tabrizicola sp.]
MLDFDVHVEKNGRNRPRFTGGELGTGACKGQWFPIGFAGLDEPWLDFLDNMSTVYARDSTCSFKRGNLGDPSCSRISSISSIVSWMLIIIP